MAPTLDEALAAFQQQVRTLAGQIRRIENQAFRKVLYVSMLDGLSGCAYPTVTRPGHRFRTFVRDFGNWQDGERVSLPQAALYFQAEPAMSAAIAPLLAAWNWGQPLSITSDPLPNELPAHNDLWRLQHKNLLWQFRNSMLHAFDDLGGFDVGNRAEPYYFGDIVTRGWCLVIPEQFLDNLLHNCLDQLIAICRQNNLDPQAHLGRQLWL